MHLNRRPAVTFDSSLAFSEMQMEKNTGIIGKPVSMASYETRANSNRPNQKLVFGNFDCDNGIRNCRVFNTVFSPPDSLK